MQNSLFIFFIYCTIKQPKSHICSYIYVHIHYSYTGLCIITIQPRIEYCVYSI